MSLKEIIIILTIYDAIVCRDNYKNSNTVNINLIDN